MTRREWLTGVLAANGMDEADLEQALGLSAGTVQELAQDEEARKDVWNEVLTWFNDLPTLSYPAADILQDLDACIQSSGAQSGCTVYYGVNASDLIFTGVRDSASDAYYGSNTDSPLLKTLKLTLGEARELFFKQNCTLQDN